MSFTENIIAEIQTKLPIAAAVAGGAIDEARGKLFAKEEVLIAGASRRRQDEFRAGRIYARAALEKLKRVPFPILRSKERFPIWSKDIVGSISHTDKICLAVVAPSSLLAGIGLDIEDDSALDAEIVDLICLDGDLGAEPKAAQDLPKLIFVIKEAVFKLYNPITRKFLDFKDIAVAVDFSSETFTARLVDEKTASCLGRREITGRFGHLEGLLFACACLPSDAVRQNEVTKSPLV